MTDEEKFITEWTTETVRIMRLGGHQVVIRPLGGTLEGFYYLVWRNGRRRCKRTVRTEDRACETARNALRALRDEWGDEPPPRPESTLDPVVRQKMIEIFKKEWAEKRETAAALRERRPGWLKRFAVAFFRRNASGLEARRKAVKSDRGA